MSKVIFPAVSSRRAFPVIQGVVYSSIVSALLYLLVRAYDAEFSMPYQVLCALAAAFAYPMLGRYDLFGVWRMGRPGATIGNQVIYSWAAVIGLLLFIGYVAKISGFFSRVVVLAWAVTTPAVLALLNLSLRALARKFVPEAMSPRSAVLVFANESMHALARNLEQSDLYHLEGYFDDRPVPREGGVDADFATTRLGGVADLLGYVRQHETEVVFVMLEDAGFGRAMEIRDLLGDTTASVYFVPHFALYELMGAELTEVEGVPALRVAETPLYGVDGVFKQGFDFVFSLISLVVLAPLMLLIAVAVRLGSPGPVIYRQTRYGLKGQPFTVYKFRTMSVTDADEPIVQVSRDDPRVTRLGKFLRRTSLDELPQIWNVLRGDMSVVGPRPHAVQHNEFYRKAVKHYMLRHKVKPGLTGWAQVNGLRGKTEGIAPMEARVHYDLEYIRQWSPWLDIKIILMTLAVVITGRNAY